MTFKLRSGNKPQFRQVGSSPAKQRIVREGEGQDQNKEFNNKGEHIGDWINDKLVM